MREINRLTGVHRSIIRMLAEIATTPGWLDPDRELPTEEQIQGVRRSERTEELLSHGLERPHDEVAR